MAQNHSETGDEVLMDYDNIKNLSPQWPYLELYEEDEFEALRYTARNIQEQKDRGGDPKERLGNDFYKIFRMRRFLESIAGFHKGALDFSGRHKPRYEVLSKRWVDFLKDYKRLSAVVKKVDHEIEVEVPRTVEYWEIKRWMALDEKMNKKGKWLSFAKKWDLPCSPGYKRVADSVDFLLGELEKYPNPKFQELCLTDLPVEIIDHIFSFASPEKARLLASTCHKLHEIGKSYISVSLALTLDLPLGIWGNQAAAIEQNDAADINDLLIKIINLRKRNLIKQAKNILSRPDIMGVVDTLFIGNQAMRTLHETGVYEILGEPFFQPIFKAFKNVILNCRDLRELTLSSLNLSTEIFQAALSRRRLVTLDLRSCDIPQLVIQGILDRSIRPSSSILNLVILAPLEPSFNSWIPVALCSKLRNLAVTTFNSNGLEPSVMVSGRSKVFSTLEKLFVGPVSDAGFIDLTRWIELNAAQAPLQLTHLKISAAIGIEDRLIFRLLDVLGSAPLLVLVLDGIKEGFLELFDRIAAKCPQLLGLTIIRRENILQRGTQAATWPYTSYEYASHFSGFRRLEHFSWNFRVPVFDQTPAGIQYFEEGFISEEESRPIDKDSDYFMDAHYIAYPFAAHCPTLKSFAVIFNRITLGISCYIHRKPNGLFELLGSDICKSLSSGMLDRWDIPPMEFHWPHVVPKGDPNLNV